VKVGERVTVRNGQHRILMWRDFNVRKLNEMGVTEQYQIKMSHRSAGMESWMRARTYTRLGKITGTVSKSSNKTR
jgi:hypothetical protein